MTRLNAQRVRRQTASPVNGYPTVSHLDGNWLVEHEGTIVSSHGDRLSALRRAEEIARAYAGESVHYHWQGHGIEAVLSEAEKRHIELIEQKSQAKAG